ncbi:MAG TPA: hypothetical protein PKX23_06320 [Verrucomicrobiota bacterium]|jgi:hypothetical protein|nr:hypothetical protein [Verrucomicrobiota bacterium]
MMTLQNQGWLPTLETLDEAIALCDQHRDDFFLDAYLIRNWLAQIQAETEKEYTRKARASFRALQMGQAQCAFLKTFGNCRETDFTLLLQSLYRFAEYSDAMARHLAHAVRPLAVEHELSGDFDPARLPDPSLRPREALTVMRTSLERWCDWIEAVVHLQVHARWHLAPETLGLPAGVKPWLFQEVDEAVISLWPLVRRHHWTYGDLRNVLCDVLRRPEVHPCRSEQTLANYCIHTLGLHKTGKGQTSANSRPTGYEIALRLCPPNRRAGGLGAPPWA